MDRYTDPALEMLLKCVDAVVDDSRGVGMGCSDSGNKTRIDNVALWRLRDAKELYDRSRGVDLRSRHASRSVSV